MSVLAPFASDTPATPRYGKRRLHIPPPVKISTPYGGRLVATQLKVIHYACSHQVWTLPGETQIICHLKDKDKIRHKKR